MWVLWFQAQASFQILPSQVSAFFLGMHQPRVANDNSCHVVDTVSGILHTLIHLTLFMISVGRYLSLFPFYRQENWGPKCQDLNPSVSVLKPLTVFFKLLLPTSLRQMWNESFLRVYSNRGLEQGRRLMPSKHWKSALPPHFGTTCLLFSESIHIALTMCPATLLTPLRTTTQQISTAVPWGG